MPKAYNVDKFLEFMAEGGIFLFYFLGLRDALLVSAVVSACAPPAANALVFASKFNRDTELAVTLVAVATAVSILTMPVVVAVSMTLP